MTQNIIGDHFKTLQFPQELRIIINFILICTFIGRNIADLTCAGNMVGMNHIAGCPFRRCSDVIKLRF